MGRQPTTCVDEAPPAALLREVVRVGFGVLRPLIRQVFLGKNRGDGAGVDTQRAIDAVGRVDIQLRVGVFAVDAIHWADIDTCLVFDVDARFSDDVGHGDVSRGLDGELRMATLAARCAHVTVLAAPNLDL